MREKKNFTLTELVLIIAILAIHVGLVLPALCSERLAATAVQCAANLKELAYVAQSYTEEYTCVAPSFLGDRPNSYWIQVFQQANYLTGKKEIQRCPVFLDKPPKMTWTTIVYGMTCWGATTDWSYGKYEFNNLKSDLTKTGFSKRNWTDNGLGDAKIAPKDTILFADSVDTQAGSMLMQRPIVNPRWKNPAGYAYKFRAGHEGGCNVAMNDGHVEKLDKDGLVAHHVLASNIYIQQVQK